jgi:hypothetical protein
MKNLSRKLSFPILLMIPFAFLCAMVLFSHLLAVAHADGVSPPDLVGSLTGLFNAIKDHAAAAVIIYAAFQVLKTNEVIGILGKLGLQGKGMQITVAALTAAGYVLDAYLKDGNLFQAAIEGLFTSGGAMLVYSAISAHAADASAQPVLATSAVAVNATPKS